MTEFIQDHQLSLMLFLSGVCFILALLALLTRSVSPRRRRVLVFLELSAMLLLIFDRYAYIFRGDISETGFWMVRISNFLVFFFTIFLTHFYNLYLIDLCKIEAGLSKVPKRLIFCEALFTAGTVLIIISQFTGLYYYFDDQNIYHRAPGYIICFIIPLAILIIQLTVVLQYRKFLRRRIVFSLLLFSIVPLIAAILQIFSYGLSLINMAMVGMAIILYIFALLDLNDSLEEAKLHEISLLKDEQKKIHSIFEQTAEALASAIDAKDQYTHGHSSRVADYSEAIARNAGKTDEECEEVFFAALLHDVGKIGIPDHIISKKGRLTDEEFAEIKKHPVVGNQILSHISESPYLSVGAHYHHERYGGGGYPEGLKGEEIPEIARIIAVADAYDAMTSNRSYRHAIPQHIVREELVKGMGTQFDPDFAKIMIHMLDLDVEYQMQEMEKGADLESSNILRCESIYHDCSEGILITGAPVRIHLCSQPDAGVPEDQSLPTLIIYDALDGRVHPGEENNKELLYYEYAQIRLDGHITEKNVRKTDILILDEETDIERSGFGEPADEQRYKIEAVRYKDHELIKISDMTRTIRIILALPDSTRFSYISIGGENCCVHNILVAKDETEVGPDYIPRIAEEISFIKGCPEGDVPNVQIDGWRTDSTRGIPLKEGMTLTFHSMSLPTARLVWHCPFISIFSSADGEPDGEGYREYMLLRLDGENWESDDHVENEIQITRADDFIGWDEWIEKNKQGRDCSVKIVRYGRQITMETENSGISLKSITTIHDDIEDLYIALTGDQCAVTDIHAAGNA